MAPAQPTILVVDDDRPSRELIAAILTEAGYHVEGAADGASALGRIATDPPDVLLLDYAMPRMSGRDVLQRLQQMGMQHLPVIVLSASLHAASCLAEGATLLVRKPFTLQELCDAVAQCLPQDDAGCHTCTRTATA
ncbi:MAG TPA: response regulator [Roseiflexaceae bacterium]|nr:response regulator [Roseiflexaceae bacterium]